MPHKEQLVCRLVQVIPVTSYHFDARLIVGLGQFCKSSFHPVEESMQMIRILSDGQHKETICGESGLGAQL